METSSCCSSSSASSSCCDSKCDQQNGKLNEKKRWKHWKDGEDGDEYDPGYEKLQHECGVFALYGATNEVNASNLTFFALYALQHRGQESAGIATVDQRGYINVHKGMGLVNQVFTEDNMKELKGRLAIGHTRYSTAGGSRLTNAQPFVLETDLGPLALAHNGQLTQQNALRQLVLARGTGLFTSSDSEIITQMLAHPSNARPPNVNVEFHGPAPISHSPAAATAAAAAATVLQPHTHSPPLPATAAVIPAPSTSQRTSSGGSLPPKPAGSATATNYDKALVASATPSAPLSTDGCARAPSPPPTPSWLENVQTRAAQVSDSPISTAPHSPELLSVASNGIQPENLSPQLSASTNSNHSMGSDTHSPSSSGLSHGKLDEKAEVAIHGAAKHETDDTVSVVKDKWERRITEFMQEADGAYALVLLTPNAIYGCRDRYGLRPLCLGKSFVGEKGGGALSYALASESCAFGPIGFSFMREILPGEVVRLDKTGARSFLAFPQLQRSITPAFCVFEYVYFARPDSSMEGQLVHAVRLRLGAQLARESSPPAGTDIVAGVPDSSTAAAIGFSLESGIPFTEVLCKNRYIGRTFIQPDQAMRVNSIRLKFNPLASNLSGKSVVLVDDSIVRGNTMRQLVKLLRASGASKIHIRISSPVLKHPCYMGVDIGTYDEILATHLKTVEEMREYIEADSLAFLSHDGMMKAVREGIVNPDGRKVGHCSACFTGTYPLAHDF